MLEENVVIEEDMILEENIYEHYIENIYGIRGMNWDEEDLVYEKTNYRRVYDFRKQ